ncbi:MAG: hypothetical protein AAGI89_09935 [Pseudomonadota bacterium]
MSDYEKVGQGSYGVYRKKKSNWGGWIVGLTIVMLIVAAAASGA